MPGVERTVDQLARRTTISGPSIPFTDRCTASGSSTHGDRAAHDLTPRVHAGVGAARARELHRGAQHPLECGAEHAFDRALVALRGEAVEVGAVVRDRQLEYPLLFRERELAQTSSMRAIGALSPGRGPSLRIRR